MNGRADTRDTRSVGARKIRTSLDRNLTFDFNLAANMQQEDAIRKVDEGDAGQGHNRLHNFVCVLIITSRDRDISHQIVEASLNDVDGTDAATRVADGGGDETQDTRFIRKAEPQGDAIAVSGCWSHKVTMIVKNILKRS